MTTTLASLVNSGYVASEQTARKTLLPTIRLLLSTYLLPGNAFSEPFLSNLGATTMNTRNLPGDKGQLVREADNLIAICEPVV
jgi:hypothetical protein